MDLGSGIYSINQNIFSEADLAPSFVTDLPMNRADAVPYNAADNGIDVHIDQVNDAIPGPSKSIEKKSIQNTSNITEVFSPQVVRTFSESSSKKKSPT